MKTLFTLRKKRKKNLKEEKIIGKSFQIKFYLNQMYVNIHLIHFRSFPISLYNHKSQYIECQYNNVLEYVLQFVWRGDRWRTFTPLTYLLSYNLHNTPHVYVIICHFKMSKEINLLLYDSDSLLVAAIKTHQHICDMHERIYSACDCFYQEKILST